MKKKGEKGTSRIEKSVSQLPKTIAEYIENNRLEIYNSNNSYAKDTKAYLTAMYKKLNDIFYENKEWEPYAQNSKKAIIQIGIYIDQCKVLKTLEKQSSLSSEEQKIHGFLQSCRNHDKTTEQLKEKNSIMVDEQISALNAMSRIFSKQPYSSLVYKENDKLLYLGINSNHQDMSLEKMRGDLKTQNPFTENLEFQATTKLFRIFVEKLGNIENIKLLLDSMQKDKNPILGNILRKMELQGGFNEQFGEVMNQMISERELLVIKKYSFHNMTIMETYPYGHAEMNALAWARGLHNTDILHTKKDTSHYIIGLASANYGEIDPRGNPKGMQPFSCMGCSSEIEVLRKVSGLKISIGYTSIDSMHFSEFYRPSLNIIFDKELVEAWCFEIESSIKNPMGVEVQRLALRQKQDFSYDEESKQECILKQQLNFSDKENYYTQYSDNYVDSNYWRVNPVDLIGMSYDELINDLLQGETLLN